MKIKKRVKCIGLKVINRKMFEKAKISNFEAFIRKVNMVFALTF